MLYLALLTLTLTGSGDVRLTLTEADSIDQCQQTRDSVVEILTDQEIVILFARCGETTLRMSPFEHGAPLLAQTYRVELAEGDGFNVVSNSPDATCEAVPWKVLENATTFCARSTQEMQQ